MRGLTTNVFFEIALVTLLVNWAHVTELSGKKVAIIFLARESPQYMPSLATPHKQYQASLCYDGGYKRREPVKWAWQPKFNGFH